MKDLDFETAMGALLIFGLVVLILCIPYSIKRAYDEEEMYVSKGYTKCALLGTTYTQWSKTCDGILDHHESD